MKMQIFVGGVIIGASLASTVIAVAGILCGGIDEVIGLVVIAALAVGAVSAILEYL